MYNSLSHEYMVQIIILQPNYQIQYVGLSKKYDYSSFMNKFNIVMENIMKLLNFYQILIINLFMISYLTSFATFIHKFNVFYGLECLSLYEKIKIIDIKKICDVSCRNVNLPHIYESVIVLCKDLFRILYEECSFICSNEG